MSTTQTLELDNQTVKIFTHNYFGHTIRVLKTPDGQHWANIDEFTTALIERNSKDLEILKSVNDEII